MLTVFPDYYREFECINSKCKHNCCIGWEIDIDSKTADFYRKIKGDFSEKLHSYINWGEDVYFKLDKNDRCPFLNDRNLCEIIINLGNEALCDICDKHPRFTNELPGRTETGLGLCCESAASLILSKKETVGLVINGDKECNDEIIDLRDKVIFLLQNREKDINSRIDNALKLCNASFPKYSLDEWVDFLLNLERLDEKWTEYLMKLRCGYNKADYNSFNLYMEDRQTEYEQLLVYIIYRHFANAPDLIYTPQRALFAAFVYKLIYTLGAIIFTETKSFSFDEQTELVRMFSSEIEYSDENLYAVLDFLN